MSQERTVDKNHIFNAMIHLIEKSKARYPQFDFKISEDGKAILVNNSPTNTANNIDKSPLYPK